MRQIPNAKTILTASIGSALEYYSYITYAMLAAYLSHLFFNQDNFNLALLQTFLLFAAGALMTPIGGITFAWFGDRFGRKNALLLSILLMAVSTFAIGLLPTPATIGFASTLLLILLRLLQGLAQGAELPGAITFITEHAEDKNRGRHCGLLFLGVGMGAGLSTFVNFLLTHLLSEAQILAWGWRIPFLLAGSLGGVAYLFRRVTLETPLFLAHTSPPAMQQPWRNLLNYPWQILGGMGLVVFAASQVTFGLYIPVYLADYFAYKPTDIYLTMSVSFIVTAFFLPWFGTLSDKIGRRRQMLWAIAIGLPLLMLLFLLLKLHSLLILMLFSLLFYTGITALAACYPTMLAELFPTAIRYTGVATCYTGCYSLAAFTPVIAATLIDLTHNPFSVLALFAVTALLSFIAAWRFTDRTAQPLS